MTSKTRKRDDILAILGEVGRAREEGGIEGMRESRRGEWTDSVKGVEGMSGHWTTWAARNSNGERTTGRRKALSRKILNY